MYILNEKSELLKYIRVSGIVQGCTLYLIILAMALFPVVSRSWFLGILTSAMALSAISIICLSQLYGKILGEPSFVHLLRLALQRNLQSSESESR